jgi:hypothetical protein
LSRKSRIVFVGANLVGLPGEAVAFVVEKMYSTRRASATNGASVVRRMMWEMVCPKQENGRPRQATVFVEMSDFARFSK